MGDEDLLDFAYLHLALLYLVLGRFATVEEPDISVETEG